MREVRWAQYQKTATLEAYLPQQPDTGATFDVLDPAGGTLQSAASVTRDSTATTLSSAAAAGAATLVVASATGITVGRRYLVGGSEDVGGEFVTVRSISGTTLTLVRPIRTAKASAATVVGTRVTFGITTASTATCRRHLRVVVKWNVSSTAQPEVTYPFDVVRYVPESYCSLETVRALDPVAVKRLPEGTWWPELRDLTLDMLFRRVAAKVAPGAVVGARDLTTPHALLILAHLSDGTDRGDHYGERFRQELDAALAAGPVDDDQDGAIDTWEGWRRGCRLVRG